MVVLEMAHLSQTRNKTPQGFDPHRPPRRAKSFRRTCCRTLYFIPIDGVDVSDSLGASYGVRVLGGARGRQGVS